MCRFRHGPVRPGLLAIRPTLRPRGSPIRSPAGGHRWPRASPDATRHPIGEVIASDLAQALDAKGDAITSDATVDVGGVSLHFA